MCEFYKKGFNGEEMHYGEASNVALETFLWKNND